MALDFEIDMPAWFTDAACVGTDPEAFFPEKGQPSNAARRVCAGCEIRVACGEYAIVRPELTGLWGGMGERERQAIRRQRDIDAAAAAGPAPAPPPTACGIAPDARNGGAGAKAHRKAGEPVCAEHLAMEREYTAALRARRAAA